MWVYLRSEANLWTVGFYDPAGNWITDTDHESTEEAAKRVAFLNGGLVSAFVADSHRHYMPARKDSLYTGVEEPVS